MPAGFRLSPRRVGLGLALEYDRILAVQTEISSKGVVVTGVDEQILVRGTLEGGRIVDPVAATEAFKEMKKRAKFSSKSASVNIPAHFFTIKSFDVPKGYFSNRDILQWEMGQNLVPDTAEYRFSSVDVSDGKGETSIAIASRADHVEERAGFVRNSGLEVNAVEPGILSIYNAMVLAYKDLPHRLLLVDVSAPYSYFALIEDGVFRPGGHVFTNQSIIVGENGIREFSKDIRRAFELVFEIDEIILNQKSVDMVFLAGRYADADHTEEFSKALRIPIFYKDIFGGSVLSSRVQSIEIPWHRIIKPLGLSLRTSRD